MTALIPIEVSLQVREADTHLPLSPLVHATFVARWFPDTPDTLTLTPTESVHIQIHTASGWAELVRTVWDDINTTLIGPVVEGTDVEIVPKGESDD